MMSTTAAARPAVAKDPMSASAKQFMLKTFPDPLYSTASYFIKDLGLDGVNGTIESLATFVNDPELGDMRRFMANYVEENDDNPQAKETDRQKRTGFQIMLKLRTLLRVPGGSYWKQHGIEEPEYAPANTDSTVSRSTRRFKVKEVSAQGKTVAPTTNGSPAKAGPSRGNRDPDMAEPEPEEEDDGRAGANGFNGHLDDGPQAEPEPEDVKVEDEEEPEEEEEKPAPRKRRASPPLAVPAVTPARKKQKMDEVHISLPNRGESQNLDIEKTPGQVGRYPFEITVKEYDGPKIGLSFPKRRPRMEITLGKRGGKSRASVSSTVGGSDCIKLQIKCAAETPATLSFGDGASFLSVLHAAVFIIKKVSPISEHFWSKKEFKEMFPGEYKDLVNPYSDRAASSLQPFDPKAEIKEQGIADDIERIATAADPCKALIQAEKGKGRTCEFCEHVKKWMTAKIEDEDEEGQGQRKLDTWAATKPGSDGSRAASVEL